MNIRCHVRRLGSFICSVVLIGSILGAPLADAATYYVATTGNDSNPGTEASPFRTINRGVKVLKGSDTLYVKSGTYAESLVNPIPSGLSASQPTTITGPAAPNRPILKPTGGNSYIILLNQNRSNIRFKNLVIDGRAYSGLNSALATNSDYTITGLTLEDCELIGGPNTAGHSGSAVSIGVKTQATVRRCSIHGWDNSKTCNRPNGDRCNPGAHGLYWKGSNGIVEDNEIYGNNGYAIQFYSSIGGVNINIFRNNYVHSGAGGVLIGSGSGNQAYNNVIVNNRSGGIGVRGSKTKIFNNTVANNSGPGIQITSGVSAEIRNNIIYGNGSPVSNKSSSSSFSHNLCSSSSTGCQFVGNPQFVNTAGANFRLRSSSPAIDRGITLSTVRTDFDGKARPQGSAYDIGAYEYGGASNASALAPKGLRIIPAD